MSLPDPPNSTFRTSVYSMTCHIDRASASMPCVQLRRRFFFRVLEHSVDSGARLHVSNFSESGGEDRFRVLYLAPASAIQTSFVPERACQPRQYAPGSCSLVLHLALSVAYQIALPCRAQLLGQEHAMHVSP